MLDIQKIRADFPILSEKIYSKDLVYLDNGATTQKPRQVIHALDDYYRHYNSNVHRGVHYLSQKATDAMEVARHSIARFINAAHDHEIIFTRGTTESINLLAYAFCKKYMQSGDEVIISTMEHHSNIVPWQIACEDRGGVLKAIPIDENGELMLDELPKMISNKTKIIALTWVSNTLGTVNDVRRIVDIAHQHRIPVMLDAAQAVQHLPVDVQQLDVDFLVFSGHKIYGPTGIGVLYGKESFLNELPPYNGGGSMIKTVTIEHSTYADLPHKFEAGTPHIAGAIGLGAAIQYVQDIGIENIYRYEHALITYAADVLSKIEGMRFIGNPGRRSGAISFLVDNIHPFDLGELLDKQGIAVRTGHHCCAPIMDRYEIPGTVRVSFGIYNTREEVDKLAQAITKAAAVLS